jgi:hypothetical protein
VLPFWERSGGYNVTGMAADARKSSLYQVLTLRRRLLDHEAIDRRSPAARLET